MADDKAEFKAQLEELRNILWGSGATNPDTFRRWAQGFIFSDSESTALQQQAGGPCAILAPIQAFMLKIIIERNADDEFKPISAEEQKDLLVGAMVEILMLSKKKQKTAEITIVYRKSVPKTKTNDTFDDSVPSTSTYPTPISIQTGIVQAEGASLRSDLEDDVSRQHEPDLGENLSDRDSTIDELHRIRKFDFGDGTSDHLSPSLIAVCSSTSPTCSQDVSSPDVLITVRNSPQFFHKWPNASSSTINPIEDDAGTKRIDLSSSVNNSDGSQTTSQSETLFFHSNTESETEQNLLGEVITENTVEANTVLSSTKCDSSRGGGSFYEFEYATQFHESLIITRFIHKADVEAFLSLHFDQLQGEFGVLLFLYSLLLTKGIDNVKSELGDLSEPVIHRIYGYGSQALVNLMLTGRAVQHVWDNDQNVGGLTLSGIDHQSDIGFITLMEHMRYCTVGSFYKNPKLPIWVLGSETHLTVLFSFEKRLVSPEQPWEVAKRVFRSYDPDGNNFITTIMLQEILQTLGFVSEPDYVQVMRRKLDSENLGIILLNNFLDEFYPNAVSVVPDSFTLWHYNGLAGSHPDNRARYVKGHAVLLECDIKSGSESNQMLTCLQTKWPSIEISWCTTNNKPPSLN